MLLCYLGSRVPVVSYLQSNFQLIKMLRRKRRMSQIFVSQVQIPDSCALFPFLLPLKGLSEGTTYYLMSNGTILYMKRCCPV